MHWFHFIRKNFESQMLLWFWLYWITSECVLTDEMNDMFYLSLLFLIDSISMRLCKEIYMPYSESLQTYNITPYFWVLVMFEWLLSQYMDIAVVYQKIFIKSHWSYNVFPQKHFWNDHINLYKICSDKKCHHWLPLHLNEICSLWLNVLKKL